MMEWYKRLPSCMHTYYYATTVKKLEFSRQCYDPIPCIHLEATPENALALPHGNFTLIQTVQKTEVVGIL